MWHESLALPHPNKGIGRGIDWESIQPEELAKMFEEGSILWISIPGGNRFDRVKQGLVNHLIIEGYTTKEMTKLLNIRPKTVLGIRKRLEATLQIELKDKPYHNLVGEFVLECDTAKRRLTRVYKKAKSPDEMRRAAQAIFAISLSKLEKFQDLGFVPKAAIKHEVEHLREKPVTTKDVEDQLNLLERVAAKYGLKSEIQSIRRIAAMEQSETIIAELVENEEPKNRQD